MSLNRNLKNSHEEISLSDVVMQFILTSIILGIFINCAWWYYKFTEFLHENLMSGDTFMDWLMKNNYQIFIDGTFIFSLVVSILSCFFVLVLIFIFFKSSDNNLETNKEKILDSENIKLQDHNDSIKEKYNTVITTVEEVNIEEVEKIEGIDKETPIEEISPLSEETDIEELKEEISPLSEETDVEELKEEISPLSEETDVEESMVQAEDEKVLSIEEIEKDFEKYNLLFIKKIYGKRVHRRKIIELQREVDKLKSLGHISEDYELY